MKTWPRFGGAFSFGLAQEGPNPKGGKGLGPTPGSHHHLCRESWRVTQRNISSTMHAKCCLGCFAGGCLT
jgi:hypothetical protein